jgi:hypothetical protein
LKKVQKAKSNKLLYVNCVEVRSIEEEGERERERDRERGKGHKNTPFFSKSFSLCYKRS